MICIAYGSADATATPSSLASVKSRMVYLSCAGCPGKKAAKHMSVFSDHCCCLIEMMLHTYIFRGEESLTLLYWCGM